MTAGQQGEHDSPAAAAGADGVDGVDGVDEPALHASLRPRGEAVAWSALGSLLGGPLVWGGVGLLLDRHFQTGRTLTAIGVVVGAITAFYIVYLRFGHDD